MFLNIFMSRWITPQVLPLTPSWTARWRMLCCTTLWFSSTWAPAIVVKLLKRRDARWRKGCSSTAPERPGTVNRYGVKFSQGHTHHTSVVKVSVSMCVFYRQVRGAASVPGSHGEADGEVRGQTPGRLQEDLSQRGRGEIRQVL